MKRKLQPEERAVADVVNRIGNLVDAVDKRHQAISALRKYSLKRKPHPAKACAPSVEYQERTL